MAKKLLDVNWQREIGKEDLKPAVRRYQRYLEDKGLRASTTPIYVLRLTKYLEFSGTDSPNEGDFARMAEETQWRCPSRQSIALFDRQSVGIQFQRNSCTGKWRWRLRQVGWNKTDGDTGASALLEERKPEGLLSDPTRAPDGITLESTANNLFCDEDLQ